MGAMEKCRMDAGVLSGFADDIRVGSRGLNKHQARFSNPNLASCESPRNTLSLQ